MVDQLLLFAPDDPPPGAPAPADAALEARFAGLREVAARLPSELFMGTSSWSFPGWVGIVYPVGASKSALSRDGLRDYARHPLLRTVGIDRSYYAPIPDADLRRYADQLPPGFPCCAKAPAAVTAPTLKTGSRHAPNPDFLSAERFTFEAIEPFARSFSSHTGPFVVQVPPGPARLSPSPAAFAERLDRFLDALPRGFRFAIELRDRALLTGEYARVLARHQAAHVYNSWTAMPPPGEQAAAIPPETQPFAMVRLLLRPGTTYENQREAFAPFDRLIEPDESMRRDVSSILRRAIAGGRQAFLLVNNKAEGSSPLTIEAIAGRLAGEGARVHA